MTLDVGDWRVVMRQETPLMLQVPRDTQVAFDRNIQQAVRREEWPDYRKWLRFYLDFCSKYRHPPDSKGSLPRFLSKLASKNQSAERQARARSVGSYYDGGFCISPQRVNSDHTA
jgi:hypothetical protein